MKILTVHNRYKFRGGEDESREAEDSLLMERGHEIRQIVFDNARISAANALKVGLQATWSHSSYKAVRDFIDDWRPDILDVHNFFPLASPSIYYAARSRGVPVVQTLHNYRVLCPGANFTRGGKICEDCTKHLVPWPGILHKCYRGSALQTSAVALMNTTHRVMRTWENTVAAFVAVSEFAKQKFVDNGFPEAKIRVKPNFVFDPGLTGHDEGEFLFVGRLSSEKGIRTLLNAIRLTRAAVRFRIVGDGPLKAEVENAAAQDPRIICTGRLAHSEVMSLMAQARCVVVPSECYETFGRSAAEAFAVGTPAICPRSGALMEMVDDGRTGFLFQPADPVDLARILDDICARPELLSPMRAAARQEYEAKYRPERNYQMLMEIYENVLREGALARV